jgi:hypothetical protein
MAKKFDLIEIMRSHFASSKRWLRYSILCNISVVLISIPTSLNLIENGTIYIPMVLLLVQCGAFIFRELSINRFSFAEYVRRLAMYHDGLGIKISDLQWKYLKKSIGKAKDSEPPFIGQYYDSKLSQGPKRLLQILSESSFYTINIARKAFLTMATLTAINIVSVVILIFIMVNICDVHSIVLKITMLSLPILSFWASGDVVNMSLRFRELHINCSLVLLKCDELQRTNIIDLSEVLRLSDEYNCALSGSLPLPTKYYEASKAELNAVWSANLK